MTRILLVFFSCFISFSCFNKKSKENRYFGRTAYIKHLYLDFGVIMTPSTWKNLNMGNLRRDLDGTNRGKIQIGPKEFIDYSIGEGSTDYSHNSNVKNKIWYKQVSGYKSKIYQPLDLGNGYSGLYIDSVSTPPGKPPIRIAFFVKDLDSIMNNEFIKAVESIKLNIVEY